MKRSRAIQLTLVTSVASLLVSCNNRPTRYCVDENQNVTDDKNCRDDHNHGALYHRYYWYYGGGHGAVPVGTHLSGGSTSAPRQGFVSPSGEAEASTARGVIGGAGEAASSGHGGEGAADE